MAKDPAFLFYPGDYLRDTQCLSEKTQVAYDRIMCEHMRNICISQKQLNFFTKRLSDDEKEELLMTLTKIKGGFQITWIAESIVKRRAYSESRRKNRKSKPKKDMLTYDEHMENENENENIIEIKEEIKNSKIWFEPLFMKRRVSPEEGFNCLSIFLDKQEDMVGEGNGLNREQDLIKNHFVNWLDIALKKSKESNNQKTLEDEFKHLV